MKDYPFHTQVNRDGAGSLKATMMPPQLQDAHLPYYWGAEFEFPTCPAFSEGVMECARRGLYPFTVQSAEYNARVVWWMRHVRDWTIQPDWIVPTHGTIFALATAIRLFVGQGQNMIVINPGYNRYKQAADRMGKGTVISEMNYQNHAYSLDFDDLERKMADPANTLLVLCNPNNPTGLVLGEDELKRVDALSRKYDVPVFCDEIFGEISLTGAPIVSYGRIAQADSPAIVCTSLGKCMSLTGVNHANVMISNPALREKYVHQKYADHYGSIDPMLYAGLMRAYTEEGQDWLNAMLNVICANRARFTQGVETALPGAKVVSAQGTYVVWVDYSGLGLSDEALRMRLERGMLFGDEGSEYGATDQFYRYSIAMPPEAIEKSMECLNAALREGR